MKVEIWFDGNFVYSCVKLMERGERKEADKGKQHGLYTSWPGDRIHEMPWLDVANL